MFVLLNGRIAGISAVLGGLLRPMRGDIGWRAAFVVGLLGGIGTRYGSGCTSGHGVCGLSRLSQRSLASAWALLVSGMANPEKVLAFLNIAGALAAR